ncbi:hypothetical protein GCM10010521_61330 [Streptomyces rameus]|uniref:Protein L-isoaspartyl methyltransferase n=1 Tax=Streptomyces rameus TaxID=68261 RepID=A0ABP6HGI3_9ACTN
MVITSDVDSLRRSVAAAMDQRGDWPQRSAWIRGAVDELPRHRFAPQRLWRWDGHAYVPVDRRQDAAGWASEVYPGPDTATVTQVTDGLPTSSLSSQAVVADMLDSLLLYPGHRVLELGTGNGWNAPAELAGRPGARRQCRGRPRSGRDGAQGPGRSRRHGGRADRRRKPGMGARGPLRPRSGHLRR